MTQPRYRNFKSQTGIKKPACSAAINKWIPPPTPQGKPEAMHYDMWPSVESRSPLVAGEAVTVFIGIYAKNFLKQAAYFDKDTAYNNTNLLREYFKVRPRSCFSIP